MTRSGACLTGHPTVHYAAAELQRCLQRMCPGERLDITLGVFEDLPDGCGPLPEVAEPEWDDAVVIRTSGRSGLIAGSNPRSVLIGVYRYLTELGCRWVRPGPDGELLPRVDVTKRPVDICEKASYRHRGICIEGAVSFEHVRDIIEWSPRVGLSAYFTQFREAHTFFERWYTHQNNPALAPEAYSPDRSREFKRAIAREIALRGLVFHDVGHGWTCEPFGMPGLGWEQRRDGAPPDAVPFLAEVAGRRELWGGVPLNTNLCYGNPEVRRIVVEDIVRYARAHPEVDVIHFWLADGNNNHCECPLCRDTRPADFYVRMLNDLDGRLTADGLPVRIVFLIYVDLLWPPETERIRNPKRFILMFAPITRSYSRPLSPLPEDPELPPFQRNRLSFPSSVEENLAFLRAWQHQFRGDSFDFDYHFMWDHYRDLGQEAIAGVLHSDVAALAEVGLNGLISCQVQRAFFPTGLGMAAMARTLWDRSANLDDIAEDYYRSAFGPEGGFVREYLRKLTALSHPPYLRGEEDSLSPERAEAFTSIPAEAAAFRPVIRRSLTLAEPCQAASWRLLDIHADFCVLLADALAHRARGENDAARSAWLAAAKSLQEREMEVYHALDVFEAMEVFGWLFPKPPD